MAAQSATEVLSYYANRLSSCDVPARISECWTKKIPKKIYDKWCRRVLRHYSAQPFQASDFYNTSTGVKAEILGNPMLSYGTTLLSATITPELLAMVRIGDGVIVTCGESGEMNLPFNEQDEDDECTPSLCSQNALEHFEVRLIPIEDIAPSMVLLSTDGYQKDCGKIKDFLPFVNEIYNFATSHSMVELSATIEVSLCHRAKKAPDDLTFGLLVRSDITLGNG